MGRYSVGKAFAADLAILTADGARHRWGCETYRMNAGDSAQVSAKLCSVVAHALAYLHSKQSDNGGFCFFKFEHLDRPNLREKKDDTDGIFYFARTMQTLKIDLDRSDLARIRALILPARIPGAHQDTDRWLERMYRTLDLQRRFLPTVQERTTAHHLIEDLAYDGGYGETPNLRETALSLKILDLLRRNPQDVERTRRFVDRLQHAVIGFTDMAGSQYANLEILVAGIECCTLLDLPLRYPKEALGFVLACQTADGSFSRVPVALPDIAYTHQALYAIAALTPGSPAHDDLVRLSSSRNVDKAIDRHRV